MGGTDPNTDENQSTMHGTPQEEDKPETRQQPKQNHIFLEIAGLSPKAVTLATQNLFPSNTPSYSTHTQCAHLMSPQASSLLAATHYVARTIRMSHILDEIAKISEDTIDIERLEREHGYLNEKILLGVMDDIKEDLGKNANIFLSSDERAHFEHTPEKELGQTEQKAQEESQEATEE